MLHVYYFCILLCCIMLHYHISISLLSYYLNTQLHSNITSNIILHKNVQICTPPPRHSSTSPADTPDDTPHGQNTHIYCVSKPLTSSNTGVLAPIPEKIHHKTLFRLIKTHINPFTFPIPYKIFTHQQASPFHSSCPCSP